MPVDIEKIRKLREQRGLTQGEAARLAGIGDKQNWNRLERGRVSDITVGTLERIARALGCKPADLLK